MRIPVSDARTLNVIYENGIILSKEYDGEWMEIEAEIPLRLKEALENR